MSNLAMIERIQQLRDLHRKRNEARQLNHQEVVEEDRRKKLPSNFEARKQRAEWTLQEEEKRKQATERGEDYDRVKLLDIGADEAEKLERKKKKKNPDPGFSDYTQATVRQYDRLTKQIKPDMEAYERQREKLGDSFYANSSTIVQGLHKDTPEAIDRMVQDLEKQVEKREKFSRRRKYDEDADIDYINERNARFNKKLERFYGNYTKEIKQNLERGTAI
ncbi:pre-mRNA-splicing factor SYF2-like [Artemia franciscana]|uniref:Pre-mRNA-splicing factor SYF2 n=1 Tax=Artemia franciscana TaxID=6661 RepID=A0AA88IAQ3_ARTSF|nr:hypothetical protein QYM36_008133 [Artemia franciscana]KAK2727540.1 hypothetical protein QYM36_008133 [Artemia franciscana]CAG4635747.1 EOG090X0ECA [Artemia franciscana]